MNEREEAPSKLKMKETNAEGGFVSAVINYVLRVKHTFIFRNEKWRESSQLLVKKSLL